MMKKATARSVELLNKEEELYLTQTGVGLNEKLDLFIVIYQMIK